MRKLLYVFLKRFDWEARTIYWCQVPVTNSNVSLDKKQKQETYTYSNVENISNVWRYVAGISQFWIRKWRSLDWSNDVTPLNFLFDRKHDFKPETPHIAFPIIPFHLSIHHHAITSHHSGAPWIPWWGPSCSETLLLKTCPRKLNTNKDPRRLFKQKCPTCSTRVHHIK